MPFLQKGSVHDEMDLEADTTAETLVSPVETQKAEERKKIIDGQYKCFEKMNRDQPYNKSGTRGPFLKNCNVIYLNRILLYIQPHFSLRGKKFT